MILIEMLARGSNASQNTDVWSSQHLQRSAGALALFCIVANGFQVSALRLVRAPHYDTHQGDEQTKTLPSTRR